MSQTLVGAEEFRAAYRTLIEELVQLVASDPDSRRMLEQALVRSPLEMPGVVPPTPSAVAVEQRLVHLVRDAATTTSRDKLEEIARTVVRGVFRELSGGDDAGSSTAAAPSSPERTTRSVPRRGGRPRAPAPAAREPREQLPGSPPTRGNGGSREERVKSLGVHRSARESRPEASGPSRPEPPESRYINAAIANHPAGEPLAPGTDYLLEVWVALQQQGDAGVRLPDASVTHRADEDVVELTIQVTSDDFTVAQDALPLKLPRRGPSAGKARFDIAPKHAGRGTLTIGVYKQGNFLLQMQLSYSVGDVGAKPVSVQVKGRPLSAATHLQKRELTLTVMPTLNGYTCIVSGATYTKVTLPLTDVQVADAVTAAREAMLTVVGMRDDARELVFQNGIEIDQASSEKALRILAEAGATLFQRLFFGPAAGQDVQDVGEKLREIATESGTRQSFQFVVDRFPIPWGMLYLGDASDDAVLDWDLFLGMRHVVEQIPLQPKMLVDDTVIGSSPALAVSVNFNTSIDEQFELDVVARQRVFWQGIAAKAGGKMTLVEGLTRRDILGAFKKPSADQLTYLYCHADTADPGAPGGNGASCFVFTDDERLTLEEMNRNAPMTKAFPGNPLVFINACESAGLRPEFYDGFIPYFMAKGARGVVGTECETPAIFATEWALRFFPRFLDGTPLGDLFLDLRREFREQHGNPLGLLYNVYCNGDTQVRPGLTL